MIRALLLVAGAASLANAFSVSGRATLQPLRTHGAVSPPPTMMLAPEPITAALPTMLVADIGGTIVNGVLTILCLGLVGYVGKYALEFATAIGEEGAEVSKRMGEINSESKQVPKPTGTVYDDSGDRSVSDAEIREEIQAREARRARGERVSFQNSVGGAKFAPWLDIDEDLVDEMKAERQQRKKAEGGGEPKKGGFFGM
jgi:hypothetical protein